MRLNTRIFPLFIGSGMLAWGSPASFDLFDGFAAEWRGKWKSQHLFTKATHYEVVQIDGVKALHATSRSSNAAFLRKLNIDKPIKGMRLQWHWRIKAPLVNNQSERQKSGDDFAARICIVFEDSVIPFRTRALNYVWAAQEPADSVFASPYSSRVGMLVLRSGGNEPDRWVKEDRDIFADYRRFFGTEPTRIAAIGIIVDTDNTNTEAEAWFRQLTLATPAEDPAQ